MFKKCCSIVLSLGMLATSFTAIPAYAQQDEPPEVTEGFSTNRFIIETNTEEISMFSADEISVSDDDVAAAVSDVLSDMGNASGEVEVTPITDTDNVLVLPEEVNAEEFMQAVEESFGNTVTIQPDYPVYMDISDISETSDDKTDGTKVRAWEENLAQAQELSTGEGTRVAILDAGFNYDWLDFRDVYVDEFNITGEYYSGAANANAIDLTSVVHKAAPDAKIIPITVFRKDNPNQHQYKAYTSDIAFGINYAKEKGADVAICNWQSNQYNEYLMKCMRDSELPIFTTAGAGYQYTSLIETICIDENPVYPACYDIDNVIAVSSVDDGRNIQGNYGSDIDLYAWHYIEVPSQLHGMPIMSPQRGTRVSVALAASAAALMCSNGIAKSEIKEKLLQSAATVSHPASEIGVTSYKVLDFYDAVSGNVSSKQYEVEDSESEWMDNDNVNLSYPAIYNYKIKQISGGDGILGILLPDGTAGIYTCSYDSMSPPMPDRPTPPFGGMENYKTFKKAPDLTDIVKIAVSFDGKAFAAIDSAGNLYNWGYKSALGIAEDGVVALPTKDTTVSGVSDIYFATDTMWVKTTDGKFYSRGALLCREGEMYSFDEVTAAEGAATISLSSDTALIVKSGTVHIINNDATVDEIDKLDKGTMVNAYHTDEGMFALDNRNVLWKFSKTETPSVRYYDVLKAYTVGGTLLLKMDDENYGECYNWLSNSTPIYYLYKFDGKEISSICSTKDIMNSAGETDIHLYTLMEDNTLYEDAVVVAKTDFGANTANSYHPTFSVSCGETLTNGLNGNDMIQITLDDGTDVKTYIAWNYDSINTNVVGDYEITGQMAFPDGTLNSDSPVLHAAVKVRWFIDSVDAAAIEVAYNTPAAAAEEKLNTALRVKYFNLGNLPADDMPQNAVTCDWDMSNYTPLFPGKYTISGELQTDESQVIAWESLTVTATVTVGGDDIVVSEVEKVKDITDVEKNTPFAELPLPAQLRVTMINGKEKDADINWQSDGYDSQLVGEPQTIIGNIVETDSIKNPYGVTAEVKIALPIPPITGNITEITPVYITAKQSVPFEQIVDVPSKVKCVVEKQHDVMIPVLWKYEDVYDAEDTSAMQVVEGIVAESDNVTNTDNKKALLCIHVLPAAYEVQSLQTAEASITVEYGTSFEDVVAAYQSAHEDMQITIKNTDTDEVVSVVRPLAFAAAENDGYDPLTPGVYELYAKPVLTDNISNTDNIRLTLHVTVKDKKNMTEVKMAEQREKYLYTPWEQLDLPQTVSVALDDKSVVNVPVKWREGRYNAGTTNMQYIFGEFDPLPVYISPSDLFAPICVITLKDAAYTVTKIKGSTKYQSVEAGLDLQKLYIRYSDKKVAVEITSVDGSHTMTVELPYTIAEEDNTGYVGTKTGLKTIVTRLTLPDKITNPNNLSFSWKVNLARTKVDTANTVTVFEKTVPRGTPFEGLELPQTVSAALTNGETIEVPVTWTKAAYDANAEQSTITGTPTWLAYVTGGTVKFQYVIKTIAAPAATVKELAAPGYLPTEGRLPVKLGTPLSEIKGLLATDKVAVKLNESEQEVFVDFDLSADDNPDYLSAPVGNFTLTAQLVLPVNITNPSGVTLPINIEIYTKTIEYIEEVSIESWTPGTPFDQIGLPDTVHVTFTDDSYGYAEDDVAVTWNEEDYDPECDGDQLITGILNCPAHIINEWEDPAYAFIYITMPESMRLLSLTPVADNASPARVRGASGKTARPLPKNIVMRTYLAEYEDENGNIVTKRMTLFDRTK